MPTISTNEAKPTLSNEEDGEAPLSDKLSRGQSPPPGKALFRFKRSNSLSLEAGGRLQLSPPSRTNLRPCMRQRDVDVLVHAPPQVASHCVCERLEFAPCLDPALLKLANTNQRVEESVILAPSASR